MTQFDKIYKDIVEDIIETGYDSSNYGDVRTRYADGTPAHYKFKFGLHFKLKVDWNNPETFPLLTSRYTPVKSAFREIAWIWLFKSNNVKDLRTRLDCRFWDEWERADNTIGKAYGYQIDKPVYNNKSQLHYIVETLKKDPNSRRCISEIWNVDDLPDMQLTPCVHLTQWSVAGNKLILEVHQRSCDVGLGLISNVCQYSILQKIIADELGLEVGELLWSAHNYHIYDRHIEDIQKQVESTETPGDWKLVIPENFPSILKDWDMKNDEDVELIKGVYIENYRPSDFPKYNYEVAI
jgi:thymidylate synthase